MAHQHTTSRPKEAAAPQRDASDVYDRQIRLWGKEAQEKMANSKVLYIHVTPAVAEVIKNLVLAGISASICDPRPYPEAALASPHVLLPASVSHAAANNTRNNSNGEPAAKKAKTTTAPSTIGEALQPVVEELNPLLGTCTILNQPVADLDETILKDYTIVVASRLSKAEALQLSKIVTAVGNNLYLADTFGMNGIGLIDLGQGHEFRPEQGKTLLDPKPLEPYVPMAQMLDFPLAQAVNRFHKTPPPVWLRYRCLLEYREQTQQWPKADNDDFVSVIREYITKNEPTLADLDCLQEPALKELAAVASADAIAPVCAVLGGILGNEIIKAISGKGEPANNSILFDGESCKAWTFLLQPAAK